MLEITLNLRLMLS